MKLSEIIGAFRGAKPKELREAAPVLRAALAVADLPAEREVLDPEERKLLAEEDEADRLACSAGPAAAAVEIAELEAQKRAIDERLVQLYSDAVDSGGYTVRRAVRWARQWEGRDPLVDVLVQQLKDEDAALWPPQYVNLGEDRRAAPVLGGGVGYVVEKGSLPGPVVISNHESVIARQRGLRELAETVRKWGERGLYFDRADLQRKHDAAYRELPQVATLRQVAVRLAAADPRFDRFVTRFRAPAPMPPAA